MGWFPPTIARYGTDIKHAVSSQLAAAGETDYEVFVKRPLGSIFGSGSEDLTFRYRTSSGTVIDRVVQYLGTSPGLIGDYNNGVVDAADYVVWRKDPTNPAYGGGGSAGYNLWWSHFGSGSGGGAGASVGASAAVPEPCVAILTLFGTMLLSGLRRGSRRIR